MDYCKNSMTGLGLTRLIMNFSTDSVGMQYSCWYHSYTQRYFLGWNIHIKSYA